MKDKFEEFVRENSSGFDIYEPSDELWQGIQKRIKPERSIRWVFYLSRAAAVLLIFGASLLVQRVWLKEKTGDTQTASGPEIDIPELKEAEMYYSGMISTKLEEVKPMLAEYPSLEEELTTDLGELDSIYTSLKNDLKDNVANHEVIEAMIENYRLRISILEDMLEFLGSKLDDETYKNNI
jgi:hypothetical protein